MVNVIVDRPLGSAHPDYPDLIYPINYGYIEGTMAEDGEEEDAYIKSIYEDHFYIEVSHLQRVAELLKKFENTDTKKVLGDGEFPTLLKLGTNKEYIRDVLERTVTLTGNREDYIDIYNLPNDADFYNYQSLLIPTENDVPSHLVIEKAIKKLGKDYRYEDKKNPIKELQDRKKDNTDVGRKAIKS